MRMVDLIEKKRDGGTLTTEEIGHFIAEYTADRVPDYQAAALLMAIFIRGMDRRETVDLTLAMARSGDTLDLQPVIGYAVDKHSSGGVGDKTTLVVLPLVAACGVAVAKMSGRGLGFSGGTLDKLESIAGMRVDLSADEFMRLARENRMVLAGQSLRLAPADGRLYALRDVTGTVASLPLIASSIMSKKIAAGANGIVLDVKLGRGAFMPTLEDARALATMMAEIGQDAGRDVIAVLSDMNQPLGEAVGNALEVAEAIAVLAGGGPADLRAHSFAIADDMLLLAGEGTRWTDPDERRSALDDALNSGRALDAFKRLIAAQGGDTRMIDDPSRLPTAAIEETVTAPDSGVIAHVDALGVARAAMRLGAGREQKGDPIDWAVGVRVHAKVGDAVAAGAPLATVHANRAETVADAVGLLRAAFEIGQSPAAPLPLFYDRIERRARRG
jgi:pyrimidine-nucleoside phosphorylase